MPMAMAARTKWRRTFFRCPCTASLAAALVLVSATALAQGSSPDYERARQAYAEAESAMARGDYTAAARHYGVAYDITKDAVLFFKLAEAHERGGTCDAAVAYYTRYLREANPTPKFAAMARKRIRACGGAATATGGQGLGAAGPAAAPPAAAPPVADDGRSEDPLFEDLASDSDPPLATGSAGEGAVSGEGEAALTPAPGPLFPQGDARPSAKRTAAWMVVGAATALGTVAAVLGRSASAREEDITLLINARGPLNRPYPYDGNTKATYEDLVAEGEQLSRYARVSAFLATTAAVSAAALFILDAQSPAAASRKGTDDPLAQRATRLAPAVTQSALGLAARWEF